MSTQTKKVLILNQDYSTLTVCSVQKAFILIFLSKAELVVEAKGQKLRTISKAYPMPSIIRLYKYVNLPYRGVMLTRQNIFRRDHYTCQYCGVTTNLTLDHLIPKSKGGRSSWTNLVTACRSCNSKKGDLTPEEVGMTLAREPFKPSFVMFLRDFSSNIYEEWLPYLGKKAKI